MSFDLFAERRIVIINFCPRKVECRENEENGDYLKVGTNDGYKSVFADGEKVFGRKVCR